MKLAVLFSEDLDLIFLMKPREVYTMLFASSYLLLRAIKLFMEVEMLKSECLSQLKISQKELRVNKHSLFNLSLMLLSNYQQLLLIMLVTIALNLFKT